MLDDTCYLLGFNNQKLAQCFMKTLNSPIVQKFMQSLVFFDAKRSINKDLLMRIDLEKAANHLLTENYITQDEFDMVKNHIKI